MLKFIFTTLLLCTCATSHARSFKVNFFLDDEFIIFFDRSEKGLMNSPDRALNPMSHLEFMELLNSYSDQMQEQGLDEEFVASFFRPVREKFYKCDEVFYLKQNGSDQELDFEEFLFND